MLIDLTYRCNMGCNHCMSDCKPNGTDMTPEILKDVLAFCKKNEVPNLIFSGGEMFENPHILELLKIIEKEWDKRFPLSFITNGRKLADTPDIFEAVQDMQKKIRKEKDHDPGDGRSAVLSATAFRKTEVSVTEAGCSHRRCSGKRE